MMIIMTMKRKLQIFFIVVNLKGDFLFLFMF